MNDKPARHPTEWFCRLYDTDQWDRLVTATSETLADYPNAQDAHRYRAWALIFLFRLPEAKVHVDFLLADGPEVMRHLHLAAYWHMKAGNLPQARTLINEALRLHGEQAFLHHTSAVIALKANDIKLAQASVARARQLAPDDSTIAHLHILLANFGNESAAEAWSKVHQMREALALNPENHVMLASMGDIYLEHLENPREAEQLYRQALAIAPTNKSHQERLWKALERRSQFFRTLSLPFAAAKTMGNACDQLRNNLGCLIPLILGFKVVLAFVLWNLISMVIFGPPTLLYRWLVLMDIRRAASLPGASGQWSIRIVSMPFWGRVAICLALVLGFWWALFAWFGVANPLHPLIFIGLLFLAHFLAVGVIIGRRKLSVYFGKRKAEKELLKRAASFANDHAQKSTA